MAESSSPKLIVLSPPGRGAVATLRIEGPGALQAFSRYFSARNGRNLAASPLNRLVMGHFGGSSGEEVVVRRIADEQIEVHCHGGLAAVEMIRRMLVETGCHAVSWQDWVASHEEDTISAAARIALADARTPRTAAILLDQYRGALREAIRQIEMAAQSGAESARAEVEQLLARASLGLHLIRPWQVVVAGRPNVGKSSLINAVAGYQRAIVHATPGTTRDVVTVSAVVDGWPIELSDTAGLRAGSDDIEQAGIDLAQRKLATADLIVLVFDQSEPWSAADQTLVAQWPAALIVHNKGDIAPSLGQRPTGLIVSALGQEGIDELCRAVAQRLVPSPPPPGAAVPFTAEQVERIAGLLRDS